MKQSEFLRKLKTIGVRVDEGARHIKLYYNGKQSATPRHPSKEMHEGLRREILKQLGIKE
ncbi:MAG: type II toxin-antitoxin system HicA family toxin [Burkholderiales bacterium]|nr:type II toxin-antitoxin system HicA family toxin [Burkholderiales bacterium]